MKSWTRNCWLEIVYYWGICYWTDIESYRQGYGLLKRLREMYSIVNSCQIVMDTVRTSLHYSYLMKWKIILRKDCDYRNIRENTWSVRRKPPNQNLFEYNKSSNTITRYPSQENTQPSPMLFSQHKETVRRAGNPASQVLQNHPTDLARGWLTPFPP